MVYNSLWGRLFSLAVLLSCSFLSLNAFASTHDSAITSRTFAADSVKIYYPSGYRYIVPSYEDNAESLDTLVSKVRSFKDSGNLSEVRITSYSSPDGYYSRNSRLARLRADSLASYIVRHTGVGRDMVTTVPSGIGYGVLKDLVTEDTGVPHRDEVLRILSETPEFTRDSAGQITGGIKTSLLILDKGSSYRYMKEHLFPKLRSGLVVTIIVRKEDPGTLRRTGSGACPHGTGTFPSGLRKSGRCGTGTFKEEKDKCILMGEFQMVDKDQPPFLRAGSA